MAGEFPKLERDSIILVTGLHDKVLVMSGKIARWAGCPWLKHETILEALSEDAGYHTHRGDNDNNFPAPGEEEGARLQRVAFDVACSTALFQLSYSAPTKCVLISTSLVCYKSQLLGLLNLMQPEFVRRRLVIIDCSVKEKFRWQQRLENDGSRKSWYEAKNWKDVEKAILKQQQQGLDHYFRTFLDLTPPTRVDAIKLVVDPDEDLTTRDNVIHFGNIELNTRSLFIEAMKDLLTCDDLNTYGDQSHVVDYAVWRRQRLEQQGLSFASRVTTNRNRCPRPGDCIFRFTYNPAAAPQEEATCEICDEKISNTELAYYCQFCSLSFHHSCCFSATTTHSTEMFLSQAIVSVLHLKNIFPENHACHSCIRDRKEFSEKCDSCMFQTLLKSRLVPPVLRHHCDQHHLLSISLSWNLPIFIYRCKACGLKGKRISYCCNICSSEYHLECLDLPLEIREHQHGGHLHTVVIQFSCAKEEEYEWCNACYGDIDPQTWVYTCQDCDYVAHLNCIFPFISKRYGQHGLLYYA